jgi:hypothetical protein
MPIQCERKNRQDKFSSQSRIKSNADEMHPIQIVTEMKMGTLAMSEAKKHTFTAPTIIQFDTFNQT